MSWSKCLRFLSALWNDNAGISGPLPPPAGTCDAGP